MQYPTRTFVALAVAFALSCAALAQAPEIDKATMSTSASSFNYGWGETRYAIDNNLGTFWQSHSSTYQWLRIDLVSTYTIDRFGYMPRNADHSIKEYQIFVTNVYSDTPADWGAPTVTGEFEHVGTRTDIVIDPPATGRYVILYGISDWQHSIGAMEVWIYGDRINPVVNSFTVTDASTSSTIFTNEATVNVSMTATAGPNPIDGYLITESPGTPAPDAGWTADPPTSYTITGGEGEVTLYAWAKDTAGEISASMAATIFYSPAIPVVSDVQVVGIDEMSANVYWTTDVPAFGRVTYQVDGGDESATDFEPVAGAVHVRTITGLSADSEVSYVIVNNEATTAPASYTHSQWAGEIDKSGMFADASSTSEGSPDVVIDGDVNTAWRGADQQYTWFRVDLGARHQLIRFGYLPRSDNHSFMDYELYVTDSDSTARENWGTPVLTGQLPMTNDRTDLDFLATGRYVILYGTKWQYGPTAKEMWFYGIRLDPIIDEFTIADKTSGSTAFSDEAEVNVTLTGHTPDGSDITGYLVTESDVPPAIDDPGWLGTAPATFTLADTGVRTVYGWVKSATGMFGTSRKILYDPVVPVISNIQIMGTNDERALVTWDTDVPAVGKLRYQVQGGAEWTETDWEASASTSHMRVLTGLTLNETYTVIVTSNSVDSAPQTYVHDNPAGEIPKSQMTADAQNTSYGEPRMGIDDNLSSFWQTTWGTCWFRVDLGARYRLQHFVYLPRVNNHSYRNYDLYLTDSPSTDPADWGEPVASGKFEYTNNQTAIDLLAYGRYFIINGDRFQYGPSVKELWFYGVRMDPEIDSFQVADQTSGETAYTNSATVDVTLTAHAPDGIAGYMVTETPDIPDPAAPGWQLPAPATYTITGDEGLVTLYGWAKSTSDAITMAQQTLHYSATDPVISNIKVMGTDDTSAIVAWDTDIDAVGRVRFMADGDPGWTATSWEATPGTSHWRAMTGLTLGTTYTVVVDSNEASSSEQVYVHDSPAGEIPKSIMTGSAGDTSGDAKIENAYNNVVGDFWQGVSRPTWYRIDFGSRYRVQRFVYQPRFDNHSFRNYELYVTDSPSTNKADWGDPVVTGTFAFVNTPTTVDLLGSGRYFIISGDQYEYGPSISELWLYGAPLTSVSSFAVADQTTGSTLYTNSSTVDVNMTVQVSPGAAITGYMITETPDQPAVDDTGWLTEMPADYTFAAGEGLVTLYAWVKDDGDPVIIHGKPATINYETLTPVVTDVEVVEVTAPVDPDTPGTARVTFNSDIAAWGAVKYRPLGSPDWTLVEGAAPATAHSIDITVAFETTYVVVAMANEVEAPQRYYPATWPVEGDANLDCKVNILDLIFVRNRLNQDVATGDNWQADVNVDGKINILDLIYVRNRLNTKCPD